MHTTIRILKGSLIAVITNFGDIARLNWAWLAIIYLVAQSVYLAEVGRASNHVLNGFYLAEFAVLMISAASIGVGWHRLLLLRERPASIHLKFGPRELAYLGRSLILFVPLVFIYAAAIFLTLLVSAEVRGPGSGTISLMTAYFCGFALISILLRLSLILPARAVDAPLTMKEAWHASRGLGLPLALSVLAFFVASWPVNFILNSVFLAADGPGFFKNVATLNVPFLKPLFGAISIAFTNAVLTVGYYIMLERLAHD